MASEEECTESQLVEIQHIQKVESFKTRVLCKVGDFTNIVTMKPVGKEITFKYQLQASYPDTTPGLIVSSTALPAAHVQELMQFLNEEAMKLIGSPMLECLSKMGIEWVKAKEISLETEGDVEEVRNIKSDSARSRKQKYKQKRKNKHSDNKTSSSSDEDESKLPRMKTANDVISRVLWDANLPTDSFTVGYLDRFVGVVEKPFSVLSWEDIASVDYDTLAVPKHRIQYFKYEGVKIWDKNDRLDNVFGSTGSKKTIQDVIDEVRNNPQMKNMATDGVSIIRDDDEDDDDDDGVRISLGSQNNDDGFTHLCGKDAYWGGKVRPNHFLCLRITNPDVVSKIQEIQDLILGIEPEYSVCMIPAERLHVTLSCLGLDTEKQVQNAVECVKKKEKNLAKWSPEKITLRFQGTDNFFSNTLYAKVAPNKKFVEFVDYIKVCLREAGIEIRDMFEFTPHMTILKFSRQAMRDLKTKYLDSRLHEMFKDEVIGQQPVSNIHLCSMSDERQRDGFYISPTSIQF